MPGIMQQLGTDGVAELTKRAGAQVSHCATFFLHNARGPHRSVSVCILIFCCH